MAADLMVHGHWTVHVAVPKQTGRESERERERERDR